MKKALRWSPVLVLVLAVVVAVACDNANPVAPSGTILTISAAPTQIGLSGSSTITVIGRQPNGNPLNPGTEIRFTTSLGIIDSIVPVDNNGVARTTLRADRQSGTATVTATTGAGSGDTASTASIDVLIGESDATSPTLLLSASPNNIPVEGTSEITIIGRNPDGTPVSAGQQVILTTTLGSLDPSRPTTGSDGTTTSILTAGTQAGMATITAILGSSQPATTQITIRQAATDISIQANPASIGSGGGTIDLTAFVTNAQGEPNQGSAVTFETQRGTLSTTGVVITGSQGVAENTLTLNQNDLIGVTSFTVTARTPDGSGNLLSGQATIQVVQN